MTTEVVNDELISQINIVSRQLMSLLDEQLAELHLTSSNYYFLLKVAESNGLSQDALYQRIYLNPSNVTRRLDQLTKLGLVEKQRSNKDKRAWNIELTATGQALLAQLQDRIKLINQRVFKNISSQQQTELEKLLVKISGNIENQ